MGDLIYMFASLAARHHQGVTCTNGMKLLADTLHPHGVKITWIVSPTSARLAAPLLTQWHEKYGDDVAMETPPLTGALGDKKAKVASARHGIAEALPWADVKIAAAGHQDPEIAVVLEDLGFLGLWGFCWEQIEIDDITDRGCPWGFYYMDREQRLRPGQGRGVIGMEWTARDLLKSFHSGNPSLYSTDPNDVARGGLCSWEKIDYLKSIADNYIRNTRYNQHVFLLQHQEAHEMERAPGWECYTEEDIREAAIMLDCFVDYIRPHAQMLTLTEAATLYREKYPHTPSSYMLWEDAPCPDPNPDYVWSIAKGPWPKTFLFYDRYAQMMFIEGKVEPICIRNYARSWNNREYFAEPEIPRARLISDTRYHWSRQLEIVVNSPRPMPYGLALWKDYALYQIAEAPGLLEGKILSGELLFLRYNLREGENVFHIRLQGK